MKPKELKKLNQLKEQTYSDLKKEVIEIIIDEANDHDELRGFFMDLQNGGCQSGIISKLTYCSDTYAFFDRHSNEIFGLLDEIKEETGEEFSNYQEGSRKNTLAWLAFEYIAGQIESQMEDDK